MSNANEPSFTPRPGDVVILRGLRTSPSARKKGAIMGARIGRITAALEEGRYRVRLLIRSPFASSTVPHYAQLGRFVGRSNIDRLATHREVMLGAVDLATAPAQLQAVAS